MSDMYEGVRRIVEVDPRYDRAAYFFVFHALDYTLERVDRRGHISVQTLLEGIRDFAREKFGYMARTVFESWRVTTTDDFGEIIFNLVDHDLMKKTDSDRKEDARGLYDFAEVFERDFALTAEELDAGR